MHIGFASVGKTMSRTLLPAPALALLLAACLTSAAPPPDACDRLGPRVQCGELGGKGRSNPWSNLGRTQPSLPVCYMWSKCMLRRLGPAVLPCWLPPPQTRSPPPRPAGSIAVSQRTCEEQDCCWTVQPLDTEPWQPDVFLPSCFYPNTGASEYALQEPSVGLAEGDMGAWETAARRLLTQPPPPACPAAPCWCCAPPG